MIEPVENRSVFDTLNKIDCSKHVDKKNGFNYLSWAWAWSELLKQYPDSFYTVYENSNGLNYHHDNRTAWVKTGVTVQGIELIEYLPVIDFRNKSIPCDKITSFDVNKSIQRSLTKAVARHGLGLYIYAGEDLPESDNSKPIKMDRVSLEKEYEKACKESGNEKAIASLVNIDKIPDAQLINGINSLKG